MPVIRDGNVRGRATIPKSADHLVAVEAPQPVGRLDTPRCRDWRQPPWSAPQCGRRQRGYRRGTLAAVVCTSWTSNRRMRRLLWPGFAN